MDRWQYSVRAAYGRVYSAVDVVPGKGLCCSVCPFCEPAHLDHIHQPAPREKNLFPDPDPMMPLKPHQTGRMAVPFTDSLGFMAVLRIMDRVLSAARVSYSRTGQRQQTVWRTLMAEGGYTGIGTCVMRLAAPLSHSCRYPKLSAKELNAWVEFIARNRRDLRRWLPHVLRWPMVRWRNVLGRRYLCVKQRSPWSRMKEAAEAAEAAQAAKVAQAAKEQQPGNEEAQQADGDSQPAAGGGGQDDSGIRWRGGRRRGRGQGRSKGGGRGRDKGKAARRRGRAKRRKPAAPGRKRGPFASGRAKDAEPPKPPTPETEGGNAGSGSDEDYVPAGKKQKTAPEQPGMTTRSRSKAAAAAGKPPVGTHPPGSSEPPHADHTPPEAAGPPESPSQQQQTASEQPGVTTRRRARARAKAAAAAGGGGLGGVDACVDIVVRKCVASAHHMHMSQTR